MVEDQAAEAVEAVEAVVEVAEVAEEVVEVAAEEAEEEVGGSITGLPGFEPPPGLGLVVTGSGSGSVVTGSGSPPQNNASPGGQVEGGLLGGVGGVTGR